jgi:glycosyltransferase involved in cell wall biosynthesis
MRLSIYTAMRNCRRQDYPFLEMLRHHLPLADEIVVNEGYSTDGTYEAIARLDPKVKVFRTHWQPEAGEHWWIHFKDAARRQCTGDWCIHLDCDEFIPDWEFDGIRAYLADARETLIPTRFLNFYGNYRVYHADPAAVRWVTRKMIIHRNVEALEFWGDGSNLKPRGERFSWDTSPREFTVHHFGAVRSAARLREAWWTAGRFRSGRSIRWRPPAFVFDLLPHRWRDPDFTAGLQIYEGPFIRAVQESPDRFVRDGFELYDWLKRQSESASA